MYKANYARQVVKAPKPSPTSSDGQEKLFSLPRAHDTGLARTRPGV